MKHWIHFPTLALHLILLLNAAAAINDYSDFFLISSLVLLISYFILVARSLRKGAAPKSVLLTFLFGCIAQFLAFYTGAIDVNSGAFGLGGGEFALMFYAFAMAVSCGVTGLLVLLNIPKK